MTENRNVLKVLKGFTELSESEKQILIRELSEFVGKSELGKTQTRNEIKVKMSASLGPTNDRNCPCCGKS